MNSAKKLKHMLTLQEEVNQTLEDIIPGFDFSFNNGGYLAGAITSDSYLTCVNVIENNQTFSYFNQQSSSDSYKSSIFKVTACNYIRNKGLYTSSLIHSMHSNTFMSYCCIRENAISTIFDAQDCTIIFENSTTDSNTSMRDSPVFRNTNISFENKYFEIRFRRFFQIQVWIFRFK